MKWLRNEGTGERGQGFFFFFFLNGRSHSILCVDGADLQEDNCLYKSKGDELDQCSWVGVRGWDLVHKWRVELS